MEPLFELMTLLVKRERITVEHTLLVLEISQLHRNVNVDWLLGRIVMGARSLLRCFKAIKSLFVKLYLVTQPTDLITEVSNGCLRICASAQYCRTRP